MKRDRVLTGVCFLQLLLLSTPLQAQDSLITEHFPIKQAEITLSTDADPFSEIVIYTSYDFLPGGRFSQGTVLGQCINVDSSVRYRCGVGHSSKRSENTFNINADQILN